MQASIEGTGATGRTAKILLYFLVHMNVQPNMMGAKGKGGSNEYTHGCRPQLKAQVQQVEKVEPSIRKNS